MMVLYEVDDGVVVECWEWIDVVHRDMDEALRDMDEEGCCGVVKCWKVELFCLIRCWIAVIFLEVGEVGLCFK